MVLSHKFEGIGVSFFFSEDQKRIKTIGAEVGRKEGREKGRWEGKEARKERNERKDR